METPRRPIRICFRIFTPQSRLCNFDSAQWSAYDPQETRATVTGQVRDPSGSSDPNSAITILKVETGVRTKIGSNDAGAFEAPFLIQAVQTRLVQITSRMTF